MSIIPGGVTADGNATDSAEIFSLREVQKPLICVNLFLSPMVASWFFLAWQPILSRFSQSHS